MKTIVSLVFPAVAMACFLGCGGAKKSDTPSGPRITGGKVDSEARPEKPTIGGSVGPK